LRAFLIESFTATKARCEPSAAWYVWHAAKTQAIFEQSLNDIGYEVRAQVIWAKSRPAFNFSQYKYQHEPCFYAFLSGQAPAWYGDLSQTTLWEVPSESGANYNHPTQKPAGVAARAIANSSKQGDIIFDGFCGGGTLLVACEQLGRVGYGIEIDPGYVAVTLERLAGMGLKPELMK
jgi:DNA modification methylase